MILRLNGIVIILNKIAEIWLNCLIFQQVTIGGSQEGDVGAGAKVLGNIIIGDNVSLGANAVVAAPFQREVVVGRSPDKHCLVKTKGIIPVSG